MDEQKHENHGWSKMVLHEVWDFLKIFIVALAIVIPLRYFVAQPFIVKGASMEPNFEERDYLIIDELSYYFRSPERGEVVVFRYPLDPSQYYVKRVIGLPGETVDIHDGQVAVMSSDGKRLELDESYLPDGLQTAGAITKTLGIGEFFVMGDNRTYSSDSRIWGVLPRGEITGRVLIRVWPFAVAGFIHEPAY